MMGEHETGLFFGFDPDTKQQLFTPLPFSSHPHISATKQFSRI